MVVQQHNIDNNVNIIYNIGNKPTVILYTYIITMQVLGSQLMNAGKLVRSTSG